MADDTEAAPPAAAASRRKSTYVPTGRPRGRPPGARNKPKQAAAGAEVQVKGAKPQVKAAKPQVGGGGPLPGSKLPGGDTVPPLPAEAVTKRGRGRPPGARNKAKGAVTPPQTRPAAPPAEMTQADLDHRPTTEQRNRVEEMVYLGVDHEIIARALAISVVGFRWHYRVEIEDGPARKEMERVTLLFDSARKGNISAQKLLGQRGAIAAAAGRISERARPPKVEKPVREAAPPKPGKKEEQQEAALKVTGKFAPPDAPRLVAKDGMKVG